MKYYQIKPLLPEARGGIYEPIDNYIYYMTSEKIQRLFLGRTTLTAQNSISGFEFSKTEMIANLDNSGEQDIKINFISTTNQIKITPVSKASLAHTSERPSMIPMAGPSEVDQILGKLPSFKTSPPVEFSAIASENYFITKTNISNYAFGVITPNSPPLTTWTIRYQTWRVHGQKHDWGGNSGVMQHSRLTNIEGSIPNSIIITTQEPGKYYCNHHIHDRPKDGELGELPDSTGAILVYERDTFAEIGQVENYRDCVFVTEGDNIRVGVFGKPLIRTSFNLMGGTLDKPTGLLARQDQRAPKEASDKVQLIVADAGTKKRLWLLTADIGDLSKPLDGKLNLIAETELKDLKGVKYSMDDFWDLTWANDDHSAFYMPIPSKGQILRVAISPDGTTATVEASYDTKPTPPATTKPEPRTVLVASPTQLYVICKNEIGGIRIAADFNLDYSVLGIGQIPFLVKEGGKDVAIIHEMTGLANTSSLKNWPLYVQDLPFGDSLSLMINHAKLTKDGIGWYRVYFTDDSGGIYAVDNDFSDLQNGHQQPTKAAAGKYPVRTEPDTWYFEHLGAVIDTNKVLGGKSGLFNLHVDFYDTGDSSKEISPGFQRKIRIDNRVPKVKVHKPIGKIGMPSSTKTLGYCYSIPYTDGLVDTLSIKYELEEADVGYSVSTYCGITYIPGLTKSGTTMAMTTVAEVNGTADKFLNGCSAALISVRAAMAIQVTNGYRGYTHGASDAVTFALYKECKTP